MHKFPNSSSKVHFLSYFFTFVVNPTPTNRRTDGSEECLTFNDVIDIGVHRILKRGENLVKQRYIAPHPLCTPLVLN